MSKYKTFAPAREMAGKANIEKAGYEAGYARSLEDNDGFWAEHGKRIDWIKPYSQISMSAMTSRMCILNGMRMAR